MYYTFASDQEGKQTKSLEAAAPSTPQRYVFRRERMCIVMVHTASQSGNDAEWTLCAAYNSAAIPACVER